MWTLGTLVGLPFAALGVLVCLAGAGVYQHNLQDRNIALIEDPKVIRRILGHLGTHHCSGGTVRSRRRSHSADRIGGTTRACRCP